jgi:hypothetical protein
MFHILPPSAARFSLYAVRISLCFAPCNTEAARIIRGHWSIENGLHWFLDVCFGEDACREWTNHAAENLNVMRKAALHLLRKTAVPEKRFSVRRKMFRATFSDDLLYRALFG